MYCTVVCQMIDLLYVPLLDRTSSESKKLTQYYGIYSALYLTSVVISSKGVRLLVYNLMIQGYFMLKNGFHE